MTCQNRGPWHLGITSRACENAGGRWFRSPCVTLKECIDSRPGINDTHYSPSFEFFASGLVVSDSSDETSCQEARESLGFRSDYPFDTEVCDSFNEMMCDSFYVTLDASLAGAGGVGLNFTRDYDEPKYVKVYFLALFFFYHSLHNLTQRAFHVNTSWPPDPPLSFEPLPAHAAFVEPEASKSFFCPFVHV